MNISTSQRLLSVPASPIRKLVPYAVRAKAEGVRVYHLNIGDPDIETPGALLEALKHWSKNPISYDQSQGNPELITALHQYYLSCGATELTDADIQVTTGGSEAIFMAFYAVAEKDDEILVFEPFYTNYNTFAAMTHVNLVPLSTSIKTGFHLPPEDVIVRSITKKARAILICNPNNPTGTVYTQEEISMLIRLAEKHGLYLMADEAYREYVFDGKNHVSLLQYMATHPEQIIVLDSLSKRYSVCGLRIGALVSKNREIMDGALRIAQGRLSSGLVDQTVAAKLSDVPASYIKRVRSEYERRRNTVFDSLRAIQGITVSKPEGAFYVTAGLPIDDAEAFSRWLLTDFRDKGETVMLAPAAGFYKTPGKGTNEVRIAYVLSVPKLKRAMSILRRALHQYKSGLSNTK